MNIYFKSSDWREKVLSNLARTPFKIEINSEEFSCESVEGFWQGLKCCEAMREHVFGLWGFAAKNAGKGKSGQAFEIAGEMILVGSERHADLIREAIKQKILQNPKAKLALKESKGKITHNVPGHTKPMFKMAHILMSVRKELWGY